MAQDERASGQNVAPTPYFRLQWLSIGALACAIGLVWIGMPQIRAWLLPLAERADTRGASGPVLLALAYVLAAVLLLPASWLTLLGAFTLGFWRSVAAVSIGSTLGSCVAFLAGQYFIRGWVERRLATQTKYRAVDRAVAANGFRIIFLCRLSPLFPYGVLNYAFALTNVSLARFALASWLGMLPGTVLYAYLGTALRDTSGFEPGQAVASPEARAFFYLGLLATVAVVIWTGRIASRAVRESVAPPS